MFMRFIYKFSSPPYFYPISTKMLPWLMALFFLLLGYGLYGGLITAPADYQQSDNFKIIYVHVPAAWMSMFIYVVMAISGGIGLVW